MMNYTRNNIEFRLLVAEHYGEFFSTKAYILNQVISGHKHRFTQTPREIMLVYYSQWFDMLRYIEDLFLKNEGVEVLESTKDLVVDKLTSDILDLTQLTHDRPDVFDQDFIKIWLDITETRKELFLLQVTNLLTGTVPRVFEKLMKFSSSFFYHVLFNLYELDYLTQEAEDETEYPFINLDIVDLNLMSDHGYCSPANRVKRWKENGLLKGNSLVVINNMDSSFLDRDQKRADAFESILSEIELLGIHIVGIM